MAVKEFREFFLRHIQLNTGSKKDQEVGFITKYLIDGVSVFNRFLKGDYPSESVFTKLFESITFKKNVEDTAKTNEQGLVKTVTDDSAISRIEVDATDGMTLVPQVYQMPELMLESDISVEDILLDTKTDAFNELKLYEKQLTGGRKRLAYVNKALQADFPVLLGNAVYVSKLNGNDATGELHNLKKAFQTIGAAVAAAPAGLDVFYNVIVAAGVYVETLPLFKQNITIIASPTVFIQSTDAFTLNSINCSVIGKPIWIDICNQSTAYIKGSEFEFGRLDINFTGGGSNLLIIEGDPYYLLYSDTSSLKTTELQISGNNVSVNLIDMEITINKLLASGSDWTTLNSAIYGKYISFKSLSYITYLKCSLLGGLIINPVYLDVQNFNGDLEFSGIVNNPLGGLVDRKSILNIHKWELNLNLNLIRYTNQDLGSNAVTLDIKVLAATLSEYHNFIESFDSSAAYLYTSNTNINIKVLNITGTYDGLQSIINLSGAATFNLNVEKTNLGGSATGLFNFYFIDATNDSFVKIEGNHKVTKNSFLVSGVYRFEMKGKYEVDLETNGYLVQVATGETVPNISIANFEDLTVLCNNDVATFNLCPIRFNSIDAMRRYCMRNVYVKMQHTGLGDASCIGTTVAGTVDVVVTGDVVSNLPKATANATYGTVNVLTSPNYDIIYEPLIL